METASVKDYFASLREAVLRKLQETADKPCRCDTLARFGFSFRLARSVEARLYTDFLVSKDWLPR